VNEIYLREGNYRCRGTEKEKLRITQRRRGRIAMLGAIRVEILRFGQDDMRFVVVEDG
jgi:hypothetical protein